MSNAIQNLLRDQPPTMILDMGLGSREQSLPAHDPELVRVVASLAVVPAAYGGDRRE